MRTPLTLAGILFLLGFAVARSSPADGDESSIAETFRATADQLIAAATQDSAAYDRLTLLVDTFGHRFSGSESLENSLDWIIKEMVEDGLENVRGQPVRVPRWVRGEESLVMLTPREQQLPMLGLGRSIGTPEGGITAPVMVVLDFDELERRAAETTGQIVLFNAPFTSYGETVQYRSKGAIEAAKAGALASLIRSVTPFSMRTPHTGAMRYAEGVTRIPHAAITPEDADMIERLIDRGEQVVVRLEMGAQTLPDTLSRNVIGEIVGSEYPDEVVVLGGHIDSWDVGQGAMDDAGGCVAAWEAVRLIHDLGLRPKRTIRVVMWTNEEIGLRGAITYRDSVASSIDKHVLAIESDSGVFEPEGFGFTGSDEAYALMQQVGELLEPIGAGLMRRGGGGADIGPLMRQGVPGMGLIVDTSKYFWYHHTEADTIDKLDPAEMARCVAALAVAAYVVADMDVALPRVRVATD
jgi:carboxypeptidase Q